MSQKAIEFWAGFPWIYLRLILRYSNIGKKAVVWDSRFYKRAVYPSCFWTMFLGIFVDDNQFLQQSRTGSRSAVSKLYKNIPEHSNPYVIT